MKKYLFTLILFSIFPLWMKAQTDRTLTENEIENLTEAQIQSLRKEAANGNPVAQYNLAFYLDEEGEFEDCNQLISLYTASANQGFAPAQAALGHIYEEGGCNGDEDLTQAIRWYKKAANQNDPEGLYRLADCYLYGKGVTKNHPEGVRLLKKAADLNYPSAEYLLGLAYEGGWYGLSIDRDEAMKLFRKAAEGGCIGAQIKLKELK